MTPFERLLLAERPGLHRYALKLTRCATAADDLAQDTMERALRHQKGFTIGTRLGAWLCFIARNAWISGCRKNWRTLEMPPGLVESLATQSDALDRLELADTLAALSTLPERMQRAIGAVCIDGLSYIEAGALEGCPDGTIKSLVSRGRAELRERLA